MMTTAAARKKELAAQYGGFRVCWQTDRSTDSFGDDIDLNEGDATSTADGIRQYANVHRIQTRVWIEHFEPEKKEWRIW